MQPPPPKRGPLSKALTPGAHRVSRQLPPAGARCSPVRSASLVLPSPRAPAALFRCPVVSKSCDPGCSRRALCPRDSRAACWGGISAPSLNQGVSCLHLPLLGSVPPARRETPSREEAPPKPHHAWSACGSLPLRLRKPATHAWQQHGCNPLASGKRGAAATHPGLGVHGLRGAAGEEGGAAAGSRCCITHAAPLAPPATLISLLGLTAGGGAVGRGRARDTRCHAGRGPGPRTRGVLRGRLGPGSAAV